MFAIGNTAAIIVCQCHEPSNIAVNEVWRASFIGRHKAIAGSTDSPPLAIGVRVAVALQKVARPPIILATGLSIGIGH